MPSETRFIFFEPAELLRAGLDWAVANGKKLGKNKAARLHIDLQALEIAINFDAKGTEPAVPPLELKSEHLQTALLTLCRKQKIPLPMRSAKTLIALQNQITFMITLTNDNEGTRMNVEYVD